MANEIETFIYGKLNLAARMGGRRVRLHWVTLRTFEEWIPGGVHLLGEILPDGLRKIGMFGGPLHAAPQQLLDLIVEQATREDDEAFDASVIQAEGEDVYIFAFREFEAVRAAMAADITSPEVTLAHHAWRALTQAEKEAQAS